MSRLLFLAVVLVIAIGVVSLCGRGSYSCGESGCPVNFINVSSTYSEQPMPFNPSADGHYDKARALRDNPESPVAALVNYGFQVDSLDSSTCGTRDVLPIRVELYDNSDMEDGTRGPPADTFTSEDVNGNALTYTGTVDSCNYSNGTVCWLDMAQEHTEALHVGDVIIGPASAWQHTIRKTQHQGADKDCDVARILRIVARHGWNAPQAHAGWIKDWGILPDPQDPLTGYVRDTHLAMMDGATMEALQSYWIDTEGYTFTFSSSIDVTWRARLSSPAFHAGCWDGDTGGSVVPDADRCPVPKLTPNSGSLEVQIDSWLLRIDQTAAHQFIADRACRQMANLGVTGGPLIHGDKRSWLWHTPYREDECHKSDCAMACGPARPNDNVATVPSGCTYANDKECEGPAICLADQLYPGDTPWADDMPEKWQALYALIDTTCGPSAQYTNSRVGPSSPLPRGGEMPPSYWTETWNGGEATTGRTVSTYDPPEVTP